MKTRKPSARARTVGLISSMAASSLAASAALAGGGDPVWHGPIPYSSQYDGPFGSPKTLICDDFEGASRGAGLVISGLNAVVEGSSVTVDGNPGRSLLIGTWKPFNPGSAVLAFTASDIGGAPRKAGFVVTDASGLGVPQDVTLTVNFVDGSLPATRDFSILSDPSDPGDDMFIGVETLVGIESIVVSSNAPISIDHVQYSGTVSAPPTPVLPDDFDADGKSDIAWFSAVLLKSSLWKMDGLTRVSGTPTSLDPSAGLEPRGTGDLDGDRRADIIWRETATNRFVAWFMNGAIVTQSAYLSGPLNPVWDVVAVRDIDGDGKVDLIFRNSSTDEIRGWLMDGIVKRTGGFIANISGKNLLGSGDLNGDRKADLVLRDNTTNLIRGMLLDGLAVTQEAAIEGAGAVSTNWKLDGVGDLDGDGRAELVWRQPTLGIASAWFMNGLSRRFGTQLSSTVPANWSIIATPDLNADGKRDLLWRNSVTGAVDGWLMNGAQATSQGYIRTAGTNWVNIR